MDGARSGEVGVLVVGAGPVGLSLACELQRRGASVRVVDKGEGPTTQSRAMGIQARTLEVFEGIGVIDEVLARARPLRGMVVRDEGRPVAHVRFDFGGLETHYPMAVSLPQGDTEQILVDHLARLGGSVDRRTELTTFRADEGGVSATLKGPSGSAEEVRARWVVGCDGAKSPVRHVLGVPFVGQEYEEAFLLADVMVDWDRPDDEAVIESGPEGPIVAFPHPQPGRWRLIAIGDVTASDDPAAVAAFFQERLRSRGVLGAVVRDPAWTSIFRIHRRLADTFRVGRCFLAGDAAHIHSPAGGQGMNTGIQDAYNLAWKLALVDSGLAVESLLDSYTPERRPVASEVERATDRMTRMATLRGTMARGVRDKVMSILSEFDAVRHLLAKGMSELDVAYRRSPIVHEDRPSRVAALLPGHEGPGLRDALDFHHGPRPGDRVPDVAIETEKGPGRLADLLDDAGHTLLLLQGDREPAPDGRLDAIDRSIAEGYLGRISSRRIVHGDAGPSGEGWPRTSILDTLGDLHRRFGARSDAIYLIRPDGYIAYRSQPPDIEKLRSYLARIFTTNRHGLGKDHPPQ